MLVLKLSVLILFISEPVFGNYQQNEHNVQKEVSVTSPSKPRYIPIRNPNKRFTHENSPYRLPENFLPNDSKFLTQLKLQPVQNEVIQFSKFRPGKRPPRQDQQYDQTPTSSELATTVDGRWPIPVETTATNEESLTTSRESTDSDEPVTSDPSTTTDTEEQSTTDTPIILCNTSLHTKEDLEQIIDYFAEKLQVIPKVVGSFNSTLIPDKHLRDITLFHQWFKDRPSHLQHVLEDIRQMSKELDPLIKKAHRVLSVQIPILEDQYKDKNYRLSKILRKLATEFTLCELTCESEDLVERLKTEDSPVQNENSSYCGSISYIYSQVTTKLTDFIASMQNVFQDRLLNKDIEYETRVEEVKNKLKNTALNKFGRTMYDILNLQDSYQHLWEKMEQIDEEKIINDIKKNNAQIDIKFITLEISIADLAKHCRHCESTLVSRNLISSPESIEESHQDSNNNDDNQDNGETQSVNNMLEDLIDIKLQNFEKQIELYYDRIFESLENSLNKANSTTSYIEELQIIQADISKATKEEYARLNDLKEHISEIDINALNEIVKDSNKILDTINANIEKVDQYLNHGV